MTAVFECVPNISEGRDRGVVDDCARAIESAGADLAHVTSDPVHHRSVFTFFGDRATSLRASVALAEITTARIDLRVHAGEHPRIGALDVLPFVPMGDTPMEAAAVLAREAASAIWERYGVPSFYYGAAVTGAPRSLPDVRRGGIAPDAGTIAAHATAGAIAVGARPVLIAFNVVLADAGLPAARAIASAIRESRGGPRGLRALGIALGDGRVQVSCNITDVAAAPLPRVVDLVRTLAESRGARVLETELIGLAPRAAFKTAVADRFGLPELPHGV